MSLDKLPFNWFDVVLVVMIGLGVHRGRKHGMSEELLGVLKWLTIIFVCAFSYQWLGGMIANSPVFDKLSGYLMGYIACAIVIASAFAYLKKALGGKLLGSDVFGRSEFYLGMLAGMLRFSCVLIAGLALLNAREYSRAEVQDELNFQNDVYGSHFFPTLQNVQAAVFERSLTGPWIKDRLSVLLIQPTRPEKKELKQKEYTVPG